MPTLSVDGAELYYEVAGDGDPLVMVHGSWGDHTNWMFVAPELAKSHRVITYDRRGNSQSTGTGLTRDDVNDLAAIIEELGPVPAHVVGNSFGAILTLKLAASRPELLRSAFVHEPPLFDLLVSDTDTKDVHDDISRRMNAVADLIEAGEDESAAKLFIETIAFGPGAWDMLPEPVRANFIANAGTWLDEIRDPESLNIDLDALAEFSKPTLLSEGDQSPPEFAPVIAKVRAALPGAEHQVFAGAGHVPHNTHPAEYTAKLLAFLGRV